MASGKHFHNFNIVLKAIPLFDCDSLRIYKQCDCGAIDESIKPITHRYGKYIVPLGE